MPLLVLIEGGQFSWSGSHIQMEIRMLMVHACHQGLRLASRKLCSRLFLFYYIFIFSFISKQPPPLYSSPDKYSFIIPNIKHEIISNMVL